MSSRVWLWVARFAARRAGDYIVRYHREQTTAEWEAYAISARNDGALWIGATTSTAPQFTNINWTKP